MRTPPARALDALRPGARVVASPYCATPETLLRELGTRSADVEGLTLSTGLLFGTHPYADAVRAGRLQLRSWHVGGAARGLARDGLVDYLPVRARDVGSVLAGAVDVALVRVGPPDRDGECSLGPSQSYTRAAIDAAALVVAEIDETLPRVRGDRTTVALDRFDVVVDADTPTCTYLRPAPSEDSRVIAGHILDAIPPGSTVQLGIGAVPEAVADGLDPADDRLAGIVGLANDAMIPILTAGAGAAGAPRIRAVELLGTESLFAAAQDNPALWMASSATVHDPGWLGGLPGLVSVCSALEIDLTGQVASESVGDRLVAGIGGSADFVEGAHLSAGGLRIVALSATTGRGGSRIVPRLAAGTPVTLPRHGVDAVVTEHGLVWLRGRSLAERAEALTSIAAPEHRDGLRAAG